LRFELGLLSGAFTVAALCFPLGSLCGWLLESQGRGKDAFHTSLGVSLIALASIVVGLPFGAAGVAISISMAGLCLHLPIYFYMVGRCGPLRTGDLRHAFFRQLPIWGVVCCAAFLSRTLCADLQPGVQLLICIPAGLLAGIACMSFSPPTR